jgi:glycosyltransferase involved in cell wall biosynthesis
MHEFGMFDMNTLTHGSPVLTAATAPTHVTPAPPLPRLAYLTTEYPKTSHTFIRREIRALEERGVEVLRMAIRGGGDTVVDTADRQEATRTLVCLDLPLSNLAAASARLLLTKPRSWAKALLMAWRMSRRSDRGLHRHLAYLCEAAALLEICNAQGIEHLHVHFGTNAAAVARLMRCLSGDRLRYSLTIHGPDEFDAPLALCLREKVADATFVAAISDFCAAQIRRWCNPADWHRIHVVRCTVSSEFFVGAEPPRPGCRTLLSIGRLSAQKGQLLLIEAMARLRDEGFDTELILAGDGELRAELEHAIDRNDLGDRVRITGWVDEATVRNLLREARALVQPSFAEGLPVVMIEAMAMQRPVIGSCVAAIPELVRDGQNGWLVTAGNVEDLTTAMRSALLAPRERLAALGRRAARRARENHDTETEVAKLIALFRDSVPTRRATERS